MRCATALAKGNFEAIRLMKYASQHKIAKNLVKTSYFVFQGRLRSSLLVPSEGSSALLTRHLENAAAVRRRRNNIERASKPLQISL